MGQPVKVVVCHLHDDISEGDSIGIGRTQPAALENAVVHFTDKPPHIVRGRLKARVIHATYHERMLTL